MDSTRQRGVRVAGTRTAAVAFARKNQTLTIVGVGAALLTAFFAFRQISGPSQAPAPGPVDTSTAPPPAPVGGGGSGGGGQTGGGGASAGIDLAGLAALIGAAQSGGSDSGTALGQAGLQAGVDLGSAGLQTGASLGVAGLQVGSDLGQAALGLAGSVTDTLGNALTVSVGAQAYQTLGVTDSLTKFLAGLVPKGSLTPPRRPAPYYAPSPGGSRGHVPWTPVGAKPKSGHATRPGTTTPVGHPPVRYLGPPVRKPPLAPNARHRGGGVQR